MLLHHSLFVLPVLHFLHAFLLLQKEFSFLRGNTVADKFIDQGMQTRFINF